MPSTSIACGLLLILIGIIGAVAAVSDGKDPKTALIPAIFGIILFLLGVFARMKDNLRKHLMHAAVLIALLGVIGALIPIIMGLVKTGQIANYTSFMAQVSMGLVCLVFVILCVKSFIDARRNGNV